MVQGVLGVSLGGEGRKGGRKKGRKKGRRGKKGEREEGEEREEGRKFKEKLRLTSVSLVTRFSSCIFEEKASQEPC